MPGAVHSADIDASRFAMAAPSLPTSLRHRLCLLVVGLTELRRRLTMACHESLSQRLVVRHQLGALDREELDAYLTHRLQLGSSPVGVAA